MSLSINTVITEQISADHIKDRLLHREADIIISYRGEPNPRLSNSKEMRWGAQGSLKLTLAGRHAGLWYDHEHGEGGDAFSFIMREESCSFVDALQIAAEHCGGVTSRRNSASVPGPGPQQVVDEALDAERRIALAFAIWEECSPLQGSLGETYLRHRGYEVPVFADDALRFHSDCPWGAGQSPALVAAIRDSATDEFIGIHRTALDATGTKIDRRVLGLAGGGAIKLWSHTELRSSLCIGEGLETSLAGFALHGLQPVWSVLSAGNMKQFPLLPDVRHLDVLVDHDVSGAGQQAAAAVEQRYRSAGCTVALIMPEKPGSDLDDEWRGRGVAQ